MNQPAKFAIGIGVAATAMAALMFISGTTAFKKRKDVTDNDVADELNKKQPKPQAKPIVSENKPLLIQGVRDLLKGTNIDSFDGITDIQFSELSGTELKSLAQAINSKRNYTSESKWRQSEPTHFSTLMTLWSKTTGKKISI